MIGTELATIWAGVSPCSSVCLSCSSIRLKFPGVLTVSFSVVSPALSRLSEREDVREDVRDDVCEDVLEDAAVLGPGVCIRL